MSIVASLRLLFTADTTKATKGIKALGGTMESFSTKAHNLVAIVSQAGGALQAMAAHLGGDVAETERWAKSLDISGKRLDAIKSIMTRLGGTGEHTQDMLKDLNERIYDAAVNGGAMADALKDIGLNAIDLVGLNADEQFFKTAEAIQKATSAGQKNLAVADLMADAGFQSIGIFNEQGKALRKMTLDYEESNKSLTDSERENVLSMVASTTMLTQSLGDLKDKALSKLSPTLSNLVDNFSRGMEVIFDHLQGFIQGFIAGIGTIRYTIEKMKASFNKGGALNELRISAIANVEKQNSLMDQGVRVGDPRMLELFKAEQDLEDKIARLRDNTDDWSDIAKTWKDSWTTAGIMIAPQLALPIAEGVGKALETNGQKRADEIRKKQTQSLFEEALSEQNSSKDALGHLGSSVMEINPNRIKLGGSDADDAMTRQAALQTQANASLVKIDRGITSLADIYKTNTPSGIGTGR